MFSWTFLCSTRLCSLEPRDVASHALLHLLPLKPAPHPLLPSSTGVTPELSTSGRPLADSELAFRRMCCSLGLLLLSQPCSSSSSAPRKGLQPGSCTLNLIWGEIVLQTSKLDPHRWHWVRSSSFLKFPSTGSLPLLLKYSAWPPRPLPLSSGI